MGVPTVALEPIVREDGYSTSSHLWSKTVLTKTCWQLHPEFDMVSI